MRSRVSNIQLIMKEFILLKKDCEAEDGIKKEKDCKDKKN